MLQVLIGLDGARIAEDENYSVMRLVASLHKLCLASGFVVFDDELYTCIKDTREEEDGCLHQMMANLVGNPPLFEYLEFFVVKDGVDSYKDFLEIMTKTKHDASVRMKEKEIYPIRKSDVTRVASDKHWEDVIERAKQYKENHKIV